MLGTSYEMEFSDDLAHCVVTMTSNIERNIEKLKKRGLIPSMTKGKERWRITYSSGKQEICLTNKKVKNIVQNKDVIQVEKKKIVVELKGIEKRDLVEKDVTDWFDVTSYYL